ncbi:MAG TPA: ribosome small subunit-dependent GTPase A, partial [Phycisphaerae bacterium]|nr:ribosome small subunit-dependent GTPase A [Phycisphaerae bacterium]
MAKKSRGKPVSDKRKVRVDFRKHHEKSTRDKQQWTRLFRARDIAHEDTQSVENVRSKGELSRKRTIIVSEEQSAKLKRGVVVHMRGLIAEVDDGEKIWACTVRQVLRKLLTQERHPVTVGDRVGFMPVEVAGEISIIVSDDQQFPEGVIDEVDARTTTLVRHYERKHQAIAANIDCAVIVVAAAQPPLRSHLIDRYIVAIHQGDMRPIICINKADLDVDGAAAAAVQRYQAIGYAAVLTSVESKSGLGELKEALRDQTSVLVGPSGVGKSSLLNALDPALRLKVGNLSDLERGRHTTTTASLLKWSFGGYVVDTPGM